jgi:hypothetical protein
MVPHMDDTNNELAAAEEQDEKVSPRGWLALATGLHLSIAICYVTCKSPHPVTLSGPARLRTSVVYLLIACMVGALGTWIALPSSSRRQFRSLSGCGVRAWAFLPAIMLFLRQGSVWAPLVAVASAAIMSAYLFRFTEAMQNIYREGAGAHQGAENQGVENQDVEKNLFTAEVRLAPASWVPFGLSLCLYGAFLAVVDGKILLVTELLAVASFLIVLQVTAARAQMGRIKEQGVARRSHPYSLIAAAICCAFIALSVPGAVRVSFPRLHRAPANASASKQQPSPDRSSSGYQTIVLWPIEKQEKFIPSPPINVNSLSPGIAKPLVIPFYGPYWYFKFAGESPGPNARTTRGDPLKVNVRSTDRSPLLMEAHQLLSDPIDLTCCREMQVVFRNDVSLGALAVGLSLTDSHSKGKLSQTLGVKYVAPSAANQRPGNTSPVEETLIFPLPKQGVIKRFDEITVTLLPDARHLTAGRKVAVERFVIIPN